MLRKFVFALRFGLGKGGTIRQVGAAHFHHRDVWRVAESEA
jgi:hypothetical protein